MSELTKDEAVELALRLASQGYRRTSTRYRMVSRIDRPDWREHMAKQYAPWDWEGQGMKFAKSEGAADYYRRIYSRDTLENVPAEAFRRIPGSNWDPTGFCKK